MSTELKKSETQQQKTQSRLPIEPSTNLKKQATVQQQHKPRNSTISSQPKSYQLETVQENKQESYEESSVFYSKQSQNYDDESEEFEHSEGTFQSKKYNSKPQDQNSQSQANRQYQSSLLSSSSQYIDSNYSIKDNQRPNQQLLSRQNTDSLKQQALKNLSQKEKKNIVQQFEQQVVSEQNVPQPHYPKQTDQVISKATTLKSHQLKSGEQSIKKQTTQNSQIKQEIEQGDSEKVYTTKITEQAEVIFKPSIPISPRSEQHEEKRKNKILETVTSNLNSRVQETKRIGVSEQLERLEPYWRYEGKLVGERSEVEEESDNITITENKVSDQSFGTENEQSIQVTDSQMTSQVPDQSMTKEQKKLLAKFQTSQSSRAKRRLNKEMQQEDDPYAVNVPPVVDQSNPITLQSQFAFQSSINSQNLVKNEDDRSVQTFNIIPKHLPMTLPKETIHSEKAESAINQEYLDKLRFDPKVLHQEIIEARKELNKQRLKNQTVLVTQKSQSEISKPSSQQSQRAFEEYQPYNEHSYRVQNQSSNVALPSIPQQYLSTAEIRELKLLEDKRRLIRISMRREPERPIRNVKAWLKPSSQSTPSLGVYQQYNQLVQNEIEKQNKKAEFILGNSKGNAPKNSDGDQRPSGFNEDYVRSLYRCPILDYDKPQDQMFVDKKQSAMIQYKQIQKWKREQTTMQDNIDNPKTLWQEKKILEQKIERIKNAIFESTLNLEEIIRETPYTMLTIAEDFKKLRNPGAKMHEIEKVDPFLLILKPEQEELKNMQAKSRQVMQLLGITVLEARALKNKFKTNSIGEYISSYNEYQIQNELELFKQKVQECLLNWANTEKFVTLLQRIKLQRDSSDQDWNMQQPESQKQNINILPSQSPNLTTRLQKLQVGGQQSTDNQLEQQSATNYKSDRIFQIYNLQSVKIDEDSIKANLVRQWLNIDLMTAKAICKVKSVKTLNDLIKDDIFNQYAITTSEAYQLVQENFVSSKKIEHINSFIKQTREQLNNLPTYFTVFFNKKSKSIIIQDLGSKKLRRDALDAMLQNVELNVEKIVITNNGIDEQICMALKSYFQSGTTKLLDLNSNQINDECVDIIFNSTSRNSTLNLKILYLHQNSIGIKGAIRIGQFLKDSHVIGKTLVSLDLRHNKIANIGFESICQSLQQNQVLQYLDISYNQLEDRSLYFMGDMLRLNVQLKYLSCLGNQFTKLSLFHFAVQLSNNEQSQLVVFKLGSVTCTEQEMSDFILRGMQHSNLNFFYVQTTAFRSKCFETVNSSDAKLTCWASAPTHSTNELYNKQKFQQDVKQSFEDQELQQNFSSIDNGIQLIREVIKEEQQSAFKLEIMIFVFQMRCTPNEIILGDTSIFHYFVANGNTEDVITCVKQGMELDKKTYQKERLDANALHIAAEKGHITIMELLLNSQGLHVTDKDKQGRLPLHYAAKGGQLAACKLLVSYKSPLTELDKESQLALHESIKSKSRPVFQYLEQETNKARRYALEGQFKITHGMDLEGKQNKTPIMQALQLNADEIFSYLIASECDLAKQDQAGDTIYHLAISQRQFKKFQTLVHSENFEISHLLYQNSLNQSPISMAIMQDDLQLLTEMEAVGADLVGQFYNGNTLLHYACMVQSKMMIRYLIDKFGLDPNAKNDEGFTCLDLAKDPRVQELTQAIYQRKQQDHGSVQIGNQDNISYLP